MTWKQVWHWAGVYFITKGINLVTWVAYWWVPRTSGVFLKHFLNIHKFKVHTSTVLMISLESIYLNRDHIIVGLVLIRRLGVTLLMHITRLVYMLVSLLAAPMGKLCPARYILFKCLWVQMSIKIRVQCVVVYNR